MNVRPLIVRELRAEARRPGNYWLRTLAAGTLTAILVYSAKFLGIDPNLLGIKLFTSLTTALFYSALIVVPAITGDSISRERREGTLGLLFLTPLSAREIVVGKTLLHTTRAAMIFFSVLPIILLPFLLGGISSSDVLTTFAWFIIAFLIAVASGIRASVRSTNWIQSIVNAQLNCAGFFVPILFSLLFVPRFISSTTFYALAVAYSAWILISSVRAAGRKLRRNWQQESSATQPPFWEIFLSQSDFCRAAFRWDTRKARDRNPIAWLQEYNWASRLTKWGWCAILFIAQASLLPQMFMTARFRGYLDFQLRLYILTALAIAFSAAASFRRERQTGALELLLVTPISAAHLIWGRLQGIWFHFFPAIAILACVWAMGPPRISLPGPYMFYLAGAYFCVPIIGFYCSLLTQNILVSWLITLAVSLLIPYGITTQFYYEIGRRNVPIAFFAIQLTFAITAFALLHENLARRRFALERAT